jgi:hypothetical protein
MDRKGTQRVLSHNSDADYLAAPFADFLTATTLECGGLIP